MLPSIGFNKGDCHKNNMNTDMDLECATKHIQLRYANDIIYHTSMNNASILEAPLVVCHTLMILEHPVNSFVGNIADCVWH